ncbi:MAG: tRNA pseudouridine(38-40) synthase TruA [Clostridia bacterium]|nr:tRNA pseudouridine(38-40) synthase TruA [Clostridia bacterium]
MKLLLTFSYVGTDFCGYQVQPKGRTVQGELNRAARELFGFDCDVTGCSRTDAGVHANCFCAAITKAGEQTLETHIDVSRIPMALNAHLPADIAVKQAGWVSEDFHPRYDVKYKEYVYRICNSQTRDPFSVGRAWHIPHVFDASAVEKMNAAAQDFVGKHDFSAFMASGSQVESTVRDVKYATVTKTGDEIVFRVAADGFLYNMVRIMTGTLVAVAQGKIDADSIGEIIESKNRQRAGMTAPAEGLYLNSVVYR